MNVFKCLAVVAVLACASAFASPVSFPECPAVGADTTGCEFLVTVTAVSAGGVATAATVAVTSPVDQGPYDSADDTLVGVLNSSTGTLSTLPLSSPLTIFGFDGDGACTFITCTGATDPTGYGPKGVTFSGINAATTSGNVVYSPGLAPGGSGWFSLEDALTVSQIIVGTPEPSTVGLVGLGLLAGIVVSVRRRRRVTE